MADQSERLCQWVTCDHLAMKDGYLCEAHLAKVFSGEHQTEAGLKSLLTGIGFGVAGNAVYDAAIRSMADQPISLDGDTWTLGEILSLLTQVPWSMQRRIVRELRKAPNLRYATAAQIRNWLEGEPNEIRSGSRDDA